MMSVSRNRALRALAEGARPTFQLLAAVSGRTVRAMELRARREGWRLCTAAIDDVHGRIRPIVARLLDKLEAVSAKGTDLEGRIERAEIDAVLTMLRAIDKIAELQRPEEAAANKQKEDDETLAAALERINRRILQLARELAAQMAGQEPVVAGR